MLNRPVLRINAGESDEVRPKKVRQSDTNRLTRSSGFHEQRASHECV